MTVKLKITPVNQSALRDILTTRQHSIAVAANAAVRETADNSVKEGRRNIAGAGRFGPKWQQGLQFKMQDGAPDALQPKAIIFHKIGYAGVFEHGATIEGKPLLWIPTTEGGPRASRSGKKLVSATVRGQPMLFDANDQDRHRKPLYIGVPSVRIPKKWRILEIAKEQAAKIAQLFNSHLNDSK